MPIPKYIVITELFLPTKGGTAVWFDEVYRRLGDSSTHIVTADVPGAAEHDADHPNTIHRVRLVRHWFLRPESVAIYMRLFWRALLLALSQEFEAVHAGRVLPEGLVGWAVARLTGRPLVIYAHGEEITTWRQWAKFRVMRFTYRRANLIIANSEFTRGELLALGICEERIELVNPGVDIDRFRPGLDAAGLRAALPLGTEAKLILSVGRLSRRKGFDQVIRALPVVLRSGHDVHYAIIGIGEDRQYLESLAREDGLSERVHFLGHVSSDDLPRWYNAADLFAMPNREIDGDNEGFGMVFIEAAACGIAVLAGQAGGTAAAVEDEVTGLRVDGSSVEAVADGVLRLIGDPDFAHRLGKQGEVRARENFSWSRVAEKTRALSERLQRR